MLRRLPTNNRKQQLKFETNRAILRRLLLFTLAGLILTGGFGHAVWQHFAALRYGYQMENLRQERTRLENQRQRLQAARADAVSLSNLESNPLAAGLQTMQGSQLEIAQKTGRTATPATRAARPN
jgi:hypothetical protein